MTAIDMTFTRPPRQFTRVALAALGLTALADHWLWADQPGGALALVLLVLPLVAMGLNAGRMTRPQATVAAALTLAAPLPLAEATSLLSFTVSALVAAIAALIATGWKPETASAIATRLATFFLTGPFRLPFDLWRARRGFGAVSGSLPSSTGGWRQVRLLIMPAALGLIFVGLFAEANPVFEDLLISLDPFAVLEGINGWRLVWLGMLLCLFWAYLRPGGVGPAIRRERTARLQAPATALSDLFSAPAILRALIVFNLLFAIETTLDLWLLWGGGALPDGMTFAEYAHRGAYPLIVTALLAGAFVLLALRPDSEAARSPVIRVLVYVWVAQNILLVVSSIQRLDLYVDVYGLTYLRIAAFIWMGLVATGLALIVARIALRKSGDWLVGGNLAMVAIVLFLTCFVDFAAMISNSNIDRRHNEGVARLDIEYITAMGAHAIPAVDKILAAGEIYQNYYGETDWLHNWRADCARAHRTAMLDWRAWTRRDLALLSYLDAHPNAPHTPPEETP